MPAVFDNARFRKLLLSYPVKAIELLYDNYYQSLVSWSKRFTQDEIASEDIVQDTFLYVWEKRETLCHEDKRSIEHLLMTIVRNKSVSHYRRSRRLGKEIAFLASDVVKNEHPIETNIIHAELVRTMRSFIETFPRREKECFLMRVEEEMSVDEIAEKLGVSKKAVERSLTSANKRLRGYAVRSGLG
jgi:RNA polymerase sigma-70 factor (ECF subfamily)